MTNVLETYLGELRANRSSGSGTEETSGYVALANLLNAIGHTLKPKVRCIIQVRNSGAGLPDGGLFTPDQLEDTDEEAALRGIPVPARGVVEVKAARAEVEETAASKQVRAYVVRYGQVLVTNYREFLLLRRGENGQPIRLESFRLASDEKSFWEAAGQPRKTANELGERFAEYLKRVLLTSAELKNPKDVAFFLASYARDARSRVEAAGGLPALAAVRTALEEALGMKFEAGKGEHFFRSTLVQTLFYGVFSAWVLWHKEKPQRASDFDWKSAAWSLHVPMISRHCSSKLPRLPNSARSDWWKFLIGRRPRSIGWIARRSLSDLWKTTPSSIFTNHSLKPSILNFANNSASGTRRRR